MSDTTGYLLMRRDLTAPVPTARWPGAKVLERLDAANAEAVHRLLLDAYANGFGIVAPNWLDWFEQVVTDSEYDPELTFVAKSEGEVVGFCLCWTSSFVKDLVVAPAWQGRGIGAAILAEAMRALRARRAGVVALKVSVGNAGARRLYERLGFEAVS